MFTNDLGEYLSTAECKSVSNKAPSSINGRPPTQNEVCYGKNAIYNQTSCTCDDGYTALVNGYYVICINSSYALYTNSSVSTIVDPVYSELSGENGPNPEGIDKYYPDRDWNLITYTTRPENIQGYGTQFTAGEIDATEMNVALNGCSNGIDDYCNQLANICVMAMYDEDNAACNFINTNYNSTTLPIPQILSNQSLDDSSLCTFEVSFDDEDNNIHYNKLDYYVRKINKYMNKKFIIIELIIYSFYF